MTRVTLERWRAHLIAAREQGVTLAHYAREHGVSRHTLYAAQRQARSEQAGTPKPSRRTARARRRASAFVAVQVAAPAAMVRARLPNGVEVEFGQVEAAACASLIGVLAALPCSG